VQLNTISMKKNQQNNALLAQIEQQKIATFKSSQPVSVYFRQTEQGGNAIIYWNACPRITSGKSFYTPRCTYLGKAQAISAAQVFAFLDGSFVGHKIHYEDQRETAGGQMRMYGTVSLSKTNVSQILEKLNISVSFVENTTLLDDEVSLQVTEQTSSYVHTGCVDLGYLYLIKEPQKKLYFSACMDCTPLVTQAQAQRGFKHTDLSSCVCPSF